MTHVPEEKGLESAIQADDDRAYLEAFREAQRAFWQRGGGSITACDAACAAILRKHFVLRDPHES